jgi:hypothetical protein
MVAACAALAGCALRPGQPGSDVFVSQGAARESSFRCSEAAVYDLGYSVVSQNGEWLRAGRYIGRYGEQTYHGYLTVTVLSDTAPRSLTVRAERYAEDVRTPVPVYPPGAQPGRPRPPVPGVTRTTARRVSPGDVAGDARTVVRRCAAGGDYSETD